MELKRLAKIPREAKVYIVFGVLTTAVGYVVFLLAVDLLGAERALRANVISFAAAVIFAFIVNKLFVFRSKSWSGGVLKKEIPAFLGVRLLSFGFEQAGMFVCSVVFELHRYSLAGINAIKLSKVALSFAVVAANYILGRTIFKAGRRRED